MSHASLCHFKPPCHRTVSPSELRQAADLLREASLALIGRSSRLQAELRADLDEYSDRLHRFAGLVEIMVGPRRREDDNEASGT